MREIKFRAWDKESKSMLTGFFMTSNNIIVPPFFANPKKNEKIEVNWMQYTGLKDKNGKEIYEGDIVKWVCDYSKDYGGNAEIVFDDASWIASTERTEGNDFYDYDGRQFGWNEFEIIGNIYENPELLYNNR